MSGKFFLVKTQSKAEYFVSLVLECDSPHAYAMLVDR